jgi:hypothetical protein
MILMIEVFDCSLFSGLIYEQVVLSPALVRQAARSIPCSAIPDEPVFQLSLAHI